MTATAEFTTRLEIEVATDDKSVAMEKMELLQRGLFPLGVEIVGKEETVWKIEIEKER